MNSTANASDELTLFIATSGSTAPDGLCIARFDPATGTLRAASSANVLRNSMFLALARDGRTLYAIDGDLAVDGVKTGGVSALAVSNDGSLNPLNSVPMDGVPCHLSVDATGQWLLAASYSGGYVAVWSLNSDGSIGERATRVQHEGKSEGEGADARRQSAPHPHQILASPDNRRVFVADLGLDKVLVYDFEARNGALAPSTPPFATLAPGAGPRHLALHPANGCLYVVNELDNTVTVFAGRNGALEAVQVLSTLPDGFEGKSFTAEIGLSPDGRFLIASNRGQNSLAIYGVEDDGRLTPPRWTPTDEWPQHFTFDPGGQWLLSADMNALALSVFRFEAATGELTPAGVLGDLPGKPMCLQFAVS